MATPSPQMLEAMATAEHKRQEQCQAALGDADHVRRSLVAYEGGNPTWRALAFGLGGPLIVLPVPIVLRVVLMIVVGTAAYLATSVFWRARYVVATDSELVLLDRRWTTPGTELGRVPIGQEPTIKDHWAGFTVDDRQVWVSKTALDNQLAVAA